MCWVLSLQFNVLLIAFFNWYYTFLQLEPKDLAEQLKRQVLCDELPAPCPLLHLATYTLGHIHLQVEG